MEEVGTRPAAPALWAVAGALWALTLLGLASIGVLVAPVAILATLLASRRAGLVWLPVGAAVVGLALLVPFMASGQHGERVGVSTSVPPPSEP